MHGVGRRKREKEEHFNETGMDATHLKKVSQMRKKCFHVDLNLQRIVQKISL